MIKGFNFYILCLILLIARFSSAEIMVPNDIMGHQYLPDPFSLYYKDNKATNEIVADATQVSLPTNNNFSITIGCYVVCYSHQEGVYAVGDSINVIGQVRVNGRYDANYICQPKRNAEEDLSQSEFLQHVCNKSFRACNGNCWAGGDSGGWFKKDYPDYVNHGREPRVNLIGA
jgi:hypothetical protein